MIYKNIKEVCGNDTLTNRYIRKILSNVETQNLASLLGEIFFLNL